MQLLVGDFPALSSLFLYDNLFIDSIVHHTVWLAISLPVEQPLLPLITVKTRELVISGDLVRG
jgi:hypothetical protein